MRFDAASALLPAADQGQREMDAGDKRDDHCSFAAAGKERHQQTNETKNGKRIEQQAIEAPCRNQDQQIHRRW